MNKSVISSVAIFYGHVASNIGDLAINSGELLAIKQSFPNASVRFIALHVSPGDKFDKAKAEIMTIGEAEWSVYRTSFRHILNYQADPSQFLRDCGVDDFDLILLASGEHLFSYEDQFNYRSLYWRTLPAFAAKSSGKPCLISPSTFGPYETDISKKWMKQFLQLLDGVSVRDERSRIYLQDEFSFDSVILPDPAFFLQPEVCKQGDCKKIEILGLAMRAEDWGIRLPNNKRNDTSQSQEDGFFSPKASVFSIELIQCFLSDNSSSEVKIFVQTEADKSLAEQVKNNIFFSERVSIVEPKTISEYLSALSQVDALVASRFHAIIMGLKVGLPVRGIFFSAHGHKMPGLFSWLGIPELCLEIKEDPTAVAFETIKSFSERSVDWTEVAARIENGQREFCSWLRGIEGSAFDSMYEASLALNVLGNQLVKFGYDQDKEIALKKSEDKNKEIQNKYAVEISALNKKIELLDSKINYSQKDFDVDPDFDLVECPEKNLDLDFSLPEDKE